METTRVGVAALDEKLAVGARFRADAEVLRQVARRVLVLAELVLGEALRGE